MAGSDILAKVKNGLAKAQAAVSDGNNLVELRQDVIVKDPVNGDSTSSTWVELVNAVFTQYDQKLIDGENIKEGDRKLVADGDIVISQGDFIRAYGETFLVESVPKEKKPSDVVLAYICNCRRQTNAN